MTRLSFRMETESQNFFIKPEPVEQDDNKFIMPEESTTGSKQSEGICVGIKAENGDDEKMFNEETFISAEKNSFSPLREDQTNDNILVKSEPVDPNDVEMSSVLPHALLQTSMALEQSENPCKIKPEVLIDNWVGIKQENVENEEYLNPFPEEELDFPNDSSDHEQYLPRPPQHLLDQSSHNEISEEPSEEPSEQIKEPIDDQEEDEQTEIKLKDRYLIKLGCHICPEKCETYEDLNQHYEDHVSKDVLPFECDTCPTRFSTIDKLKSHKNKEYCGSSFTCLICQTNYPNLVALLSHQPVHADTAQCEVCKLKFPDMENLKEHQMLCKKENHLRCKFCDRKYEVRNSYNGHQRNGCLNGPFLCTHCPYRFVNEQRLKVHIKLTHQRNCILQCKHCPKAFAKKTELIAHETLCGQFVYNCEICTLKFITEVEYKSHKARHDARKTFICNDCDKVLDNHEALKVHTQIHIAEGIIKCKICQKKFPKQFSLKKHLEDGCTLGIYVCFICQVSFVTLASLTKHQKTHPEKTNVRCDICLLKFPNNESLKDHRPLCFLEMCTCSFCGQKFTKGNGRLNLRAHKKRGCKNGPFKCEFCIHRFTNEEYLNKHVHDKHKNPVRVDMLYTCHLCQKTFRNKNNLIIHERGHTGEKPFACDECDEKYHSQKDLREHKQIHSKLAVQCDVCEEKFTFSKQLRHHEKTGCIKGNFPCDKCKKRFVSEDKMRRHRRSEHPIDFFHCKFCEQKFKFRRYLKKHEIVYHTMGISKCYICAKKFQRPGELRNHLQIHNGIPYSCLYCKMPFISKDGWKGHEKKHVATKTHACLSCKDIFESSESLEKHKPECNILSCDKCPERFTNQTRLSRHLRNHSETRPYYECKICFASHDTSEELVDHQNSHQDVYQCAFCPFVFETYLDMNCHEKVHQGGSIFECKICHKCFVNAQDFKNHENAHRKTNTKKCKICSKVFASINGFRKHIQGHKTIHCKSREVEKEEDS